MEVIDLVVLGVDKVVGHKPGQTTLWIYPFEKFHRLHILREMVAMVEVASVSFDRKVPIMHGWLEGFQLAVWEGVCHLQMHGFQFCKGVGKLGFSEASELDVLADKATTTKVGCAATVLLSVGRHCLLLLTTHPFFCTGGRSFPQSTP
jgi:hypothetical protein